MIIVFGSINIDMIMPVKAFPAPGETVLCHQYISRCGGKGANQAFAAARTEAKVAMVGRIGDDAFGRRSINNLKQQSVLTTGIGISEQPTGCAAITVNAAGENTIVVASGANLDATGDQVPDEILRDGNTVLLQMEVTPVESWDVIRRAHNNGARTILNPSPVGNVPHEVLDDLDFLILNEGESGALAERLGLSADNVEALAVKMADLGDLCCVITCGEKGAIAAHHGETWRIGALEIEVVDTTGAGDTFCGVFAAALENGDDIPGALHRASVAGALCCRTLGAQEGMPYAEEIDEQLAALAPPEKIS